ncbi:MAG: hypothetical protein JW722_01150 [Demequinaceae bacterium]|nr:hypothetical protein [Demequinaceae bacterium]
MKKTKAFAFAGATALMAVSGVIMLSTPANANWDYLNLGNCHSTIFNGTTYAQTSVTPPVSCASELIGVKVQFPGIPAYWTGWKSSSAYIVTTYAPSGSYVIQSYHSVVNGTAYKYLSIS